MATLRFIVKWVIALLLILSVVTAALYYFIEPKQNRNWTIEHRILANIQFSGDTNNPDILVKNIRDFQWKTSTANDPANIVRYQDMSFKLENIVELKAVVSHFSAISSIAHVFMIFVLDDGREFGVSIEARREVGEPFSIQGGLFAQFELMYVLATPQDLLGIRKLNKDAIHIYPIKESNKENARKLFKLIATEVNALNKTPELYHLFFKNCTNQLVKHVSVVTKKKYPWYFQTLAPGNTAKILYYFDLIDMPNMSFDDIQTKTLVK